MQKWHISIPTTAVYVKFFDILGASTVFSRNCTGSAVINMSYKEFYDLLREKAGVACPTSEHVADTIFHPFLAPHEGNIENIDDGIKNGRIDQRHHYLSADSALRWRSVIDAQSYKTYAHCKHSLEVHTADEIWEKYISDNLPGDIIMLAGGGSPEKDMIILNNIIPRLSGSEAVHYSLIDASFYMLLSS